MRTERKRFIQVSLLDDGRIAVGAELLGGEPSECLECIREAPRQVLDALDDWLDSHEGEAIAVIVKGAATALATWKTRSASMAMYWLATVLGKSWHPRFATPVPWGEPHQTASVTALPWRADPNTTERSRDDALEDDHNEVA